MQSTPTEIVSIILLASLVFLLAPLFLLLYIVSYNKKKKLHQQEKELITERFESELLKTSIEVQEQTMQTIATDLHDNIGQLLSLTHITLSSINLNDYEKAKHKIDHSLELIGNSIRDLRQLAKVIQGEQLLENGLSQALEKGINWLKHSRNYNITFENGLKDTELSSASKDLVILRIFQEVFNNIVKHAEAGHIDVIMELEKDKLSIVIKDDGKGFDITESSSRNQGLGLNNLKKRSKLIGGDMDISSKLGKGTRISITVPYP
ncbi:sensor histidine kinase [Olivibacter sitiensis]|uniref:sensor histidine kinase n=1 Tax=Olivibacter sitiensis TaxID=376470 RepID=UPI0003F7021D|nr:ATP-binding protein [Olivibacter sitiensis]